MRLTAAPTGGLRARARAHLFMVGLPENARGPAPLGHRLLGSRDRRWPRRSARRHRRESRGALQAEACPGPGTQTSRGGHHPEQSAGRQERPLGVTRTEPPLLQEPELCPRPLSRAPEVSLWPLLGPSDVSLPAPSSQIPPYCLSLTCDGHLPG